MKRLICYASGALRGIYYAGVMRALTEAGIAFDEYAGISVGSNAASWHASGQALEVLDAWDAFSALRLSLHPIMDNDHSKTLDWIIHNITMPFLNIDAIQASGHTLHVGVSALKAPWHGGLLERRYFHFKDAFDQDVFRAAIRASCFMPFINGIFAAMRIDGGSYLDGGLTGRIPLDCTDLTRFDEVWLAVASPNAMAELQTELGRHHGTRIIVITPSRPTPVSRMTIDKTRFHDTATLGYYDTIRVIKRLDKPS